MTIYDNLKISILKVCIIAYLLSKKYISKQKIIKQIKLILKKKY